MSRYFAIQTWVGSHENEPDYNGQQCGERNVRSVEIPTFDRHGRPNINAFSDAAIEARKEKRKTSLPLTDRILPQAKRVNLLTEQMRELEIEYKSGKMSITDYTLYRNILSVKRSRAEVLLKKAISVRPTTHEDDEYADEMAEDGVETAYTINDRYSTSAPVTPSCRVSWIDDLSPSNSFKKILQIACKVMKTAVHYKHKISSYLNTLKEV